jgi:addiction module RelE/StbE family toxin
MRVRWLEDAVADLHAIFDAISQDRPCAASEVVGQLVAAVEPLTEFPSRGRPGRVMGTRELIIPPYLVAYRVRADTVEILRVLHGSRRWPEDF